MNCSRTQTIDTCFHLNPNSVSPRQHGTILSQHVSSVDKRGILTERVVTNLHPLLQSALTHWTITPCQDDPLSLCQGRSILQESVQHCWCCLPLLPGHQTCQLGRDRGGAVCEQRDSERQCRVRNQTASLSHWCGDRKWERGNNMNNNNFNWITFTNIS